MPVPKRTGLQVLTSIPPSTLGWTRKKEVATGLMYYYGDWSWLWMGLMMVLFWGGLIALIVWLVRATARPGGPPPTDGPAETLRRRLAAGEITPDEYERTRKLLQG